MAYKKYSQSMKDRMDESSGMKEYYEKDNMGKKSKKDKYMHSYSKMSILPEENITYPIERPGYANGYYMDDTITGIDKQIGNDVKTLKRQMKNDS